LRVDRAAIELKRRGMLTPTLGQERHRPAEEGPQAAVLKR
jgi:hypothetical protein